MDFSSKDIIASISRLSVAVCTIYLKKKKRKYHNLVHTTRFLSNFPRVTSLNNGGRRGRDRMVVGFIATYTASAYHH